MGPGKTVGLVGPPGSGKSTIAHLIARFYDVEGGRITVDGRDIREATLESLRRAVSIVQQDNFIFTAAVDNNITYGDPWSDRDRIAPRAGFAALAEAAGADGETVPGTHNWLLADAERFADVVWRALADAGVLDEAIGARRQGRGA